jgi:WD40 repeat protein
MGAGGSEPPENPYPLLGPCQDPEVFRGREGSILEVLRLLDKNGLLLCLRAPSGIGKTSFLEAGLRPALWQQGRPAALTRRPHEPSIARRLLFELAELPRGFELSDADLRGFVRRLQELGEAGGTPVIILDQFEDAVRCDDQGSALARVGPLLAATADASRSSGAGFVCQWVLAYRDELHGEVHQWLRNVLREARTLGQDLAGLPEHLDLTGLDYLRDMRLPPFGSAGPGEDKVACAEGAFLAAIEAPLVDDEGRPRGRFRFKDGAARKIAAAFAEARAKDPRAALTPELQIVLDRLLGSAPVTDGVRWISVDDDPRALIQGALEDHLHRKLTQAFASVRAQKRRTGAFLALLQLVDRERRRCVPVRVDVLRESIGQDGQLVLDRLEHAEIRLLRQEKNDVDLEFYYVLPHDELAGLLLDLENDPVARERYGFEEELVELRALVALHVELHERGNPVGTDLSEELYARVQKGSGSLLFTERRRAWWEECRARKENEQWQLERLRRRRWTQAAAASGTILAAAVLVYLTIVPGRHRARVEGAGSYAEAAKAYHDWAGLPGHEGVAREAFARSLEQRALAAGALEKLDEALLWRLKALEVQDSWAERREIAYLASLWPEDALVLAHPQPVRRLSLSPRGDRVLTQTSEGAYLWSVDSGRIVERARSVSTFSREGRWWFTEVSEVSGARVRIWSADSGKPVGSAFTVRGFIGYGAEPTVSPDGRFVVTCTSEGGMRLWSAGSGKEIGAVSAKCLGKAVAWSPDSATLAAIEGSRVSLWSTEAREIRRWDLRPWKPVYPVFDPTGDKLAVWGQEAVQVLRVDDGSSVGSRVSPRGGITAFAFSDDGYYLATAGDTELSLWRSEDATVEATLPRRCGSANIRVLSRNAIVEVCGGEIVRHAVDADPGAPYRSARCGTPCTSAAIGVDGRPVVMRQTGAGRVIVARGFREEVPPRLVFPREVHVEATADGRQVLVASPLGFPAGGGQGDEIPVEGQFWDTETGERVGMSFDLGDTRNDWSWSGARHTKLLVSESGTLALVKSRRQLRLFDRGAGSEVCEGLLKGWSDAVLSPDGRALVTWTSKEMRLWMTDTCQPMRSSKVPFKRAPPFVGFCPDSGCVGALFGDTISRWTLDRNGFTKITDEHAGGDPSYRAGGQLFTTNHSVVLSGRRGMKILDGKSWGVKCLLDVPDPTVWSMSPDGRWLAVQDAGNRVRVHRMSDCQAHGQSIDVGGRGVEISFNAPGDTLMLATASWLHLLHVDERGVTIRASRVLADPPLRVTSDELTPAGPSYRVVTRASTGTVAVETIWLEPPPGVEPIPGDPAKLVKEWTKRLALQVDAEGKVRSYAPPDVP